MKDPPILQVWVKDTIRKLECWSQQINNNAFIIVFVCFKNVCKQKFRQGMQFKFQIYHLLQTRLDAIIFTESHAAARTVFPFASFGQQLEGQN